MKITISKDFLNEIVQSIEKNYDLEVIQLKNRLGRKTNKFLLVNCKCGSDDCYENEIVTLQYIISELLTFTPY